MNALAEYFFRLWFDSLLRDPIKRMLGLLAETYRTYVPKFEFRSFIGLSQTYTHTKSLDPAWTIGGSGDKPDKAGNRIKAK